MYRYYFPICPVKGPIEPPIPYGHMLSKGSVPNKCADCGYLFEGSCRRFPEAQPFLHLDHGPCGIDGPTKPVYFENQFIKAKVKVPQKCVSCKFLETDRIRGFVCRKDEDKWGDFPRGLDWGDWKPDLTTDCIHLKLPLPKVTTLKLSQHACNNDILEFIKEHRRINPGISTEEVKADFKHFRDILKKYL